MKFGASVWPFKWDAPYDSAVARIGDLGFHAVELIAWEPEQFDDYYTPETVKRLRSVLDGNDMALSQFVVQNRNLASQDADERRASVEIFKRGVQTGVELGAPVINTVTHFPFAITQPRITDRPHVQMFTVDVPGDLNWDRNWSDYVAVLRECAEYAQSMGVKYSIEPHPFRYGANTEGLLRILDAVDCDALGVNFDPSHLFPVGDIPHVSLYRLRGRVFHCHVSDNDGETNVHWRPGKGKIDWASVFTALKDTGYEGVVSLEFEDIPGVSRGVADVPGVYRGNAEATDGFAAEYRTALEYLTGLATDAGLAVD